MSHLTATLTNGGNATFALGTAATTDVGDGTTTDPCPADQTLVITITGAVGATGGDALLSVGADVTDSAGVTDVAGNNWDLSTGDVTVDVEGAEAS